MSKNSCFRCYLLILISTTSLIFSCSSSKNDLTIYGISKDLADFRKLHYSNIGYEFDLVIPDQKDQLINGALKISLELSSEVDIILDFDQPKDHILDLSLNDVQVSYELENNHIVIPKQYVSTGQNQLEISFVAGDEALNRHDEYLYALFVPARASTSLPLFDQPDLKATYQLNLTIPSGWEALSNGGINSVSEQDGQNKIAFNNTLPISSYLFAFTAGQFDVIERETPYGKMRMLHRETDSLKLNSNVDEIFDWHIKSLDWLEKYTDINYPFEKFDFALIPSFQYGGMEHPGAVFYKASSLLLDKGATVNNHVSRGRLIAHETAHMWFGDLVTMPWFDDVWLKEVFANFMAAKIINPSFPEIDHDLQFLLGHYPSAYSVDRTEGSHPIAQQLDNLCDAGSLYGSIIYQKAPIVMRMLEDRIGSEVFQEGIQDYLATNQYGNASWDDLIGIMSQKSGENLTRWDKVWVKSKGMPMLVPNVRDKNGKLRSINIFMAYTSDLIMEQKLQLEMGADSLAKKFTTEVLMDDRVVKIDGDSLFIPNYIFLNAQGKAYGYFRMGSGSKQHYLDSVNEITSPVFRAAIWVNFYEAVVRADLDPVIFVNQLIKAIPKESDPLIVSYMNTSLRSVFWKFLSPKQREELSSKVEGVLFNMTVSGETQSIRSSFFESFYRLATTPEGLAMVKGIWDGNMEMQQLDIGESDYIQMAYELAIRLPDESELILKLQADRINNIDRKERFNWVAKALHPETQMRDDFFQSLKNSANRSNEPWVLEGLRYLHHPLRQDESVKYINESLELLEEIKSTGDIFFPKRWLDNTFGGHQSPAAADAFRNFMYKHHDMPQDLKNKILQAADLLLRAEEVQQKLGDEAVDS